MRDVAVGRNGKMKKEDVSRIADGRVFTGEQALQLKLIDELGSMDDAVRDRRRLARDRRGAGPALAETPRRRLFDLLNAGDAETLLQRVVSRRVPQFLYRW